MTRIRLGASLILLALALLLVSWLPRGAGDQQQVAALSEVVSEAPLPPTATAMPTRTPAEYGRALFTARGCSTCHRHDGLNLKQDPSLKMGPNLTVYEPDPDFVRVWLADPAAVRPGTQMPDLNLSEEQIEALLVFLEE